MLWKANSVCDFAQRLFLNSTITKLLQVRLSHSMLRPPRHAPS